MPCDEITVHEERAYNNVCDSHVYLLDCKVLQLWLFWILD